MPKLSDSKIMDLPKIGDSRGNLSVLEQLKQVPFEIKRTYWIYDVPGGFSRGGHAYKENQEFIVALSGSFEVELDDGENKKVYSLNRSYMGLYVPKGIWRKMQNFSTNSLALVLSSTEYSEMDYIKNYDEYKVWAIENRNLVEDLFVVDNVVEYNSPDLHNNVVKSVFDCSLCELSKWHDVEGNLTYMYENIHVPFPINRVFYSYDIPGGEERGAHAHKKCHQFIVAASGAFDVVLDDGVNKRTVTLNRPFWGLHVPPGIWASEQGFSSGSICLVLASHGYSEDDYIRNYEEFLEYVKERDSK
jgi:dTDP-4-dehydrorhamnose 3,5-epimerase-like enzyme